MEMLEMKTVTEKTQTLKTSSTGSAAVNSQGKNK